MNMKKSQSIAMSILLMFLILWILLKYTDITLIFQAYKQISAKTVLLTFGLYIIMAFLRLHRFKTFFKEVSHTKLFFITGAHVMLSNVLPMRLGEYSLLHYLKKEGVPRTESGAVLIIVRIFDLFTVAILALIAYFFTKVQGLTTIFASIGIFLVLSISGFFFINTKIFTRIIEKLRNTKVKIVSTVFHELFLSIKKHSTILTLPKLFVTSLLVWVVQSIIAYIVAKELQLPVSIIGIILTSSIASFLGGLPIQGFAGFGTVEVSWTLPLVVALQVPVAQAVTYAFVIHTMFIAYGIIIGVTSLTFLHFIQHLQYTVSERR